MLFSLVLLSKCGEILRCGGFFCFVFRVGVCRATGMCVSVFGVGFVCCFCWGFLSLNSSMSWFCVPVTLYQTWACYRSRFVDQKVDTKSPFFELLFPGNF